MLPVERLSQITQRFEFLEARLNAGPAPDEIARISREYAELKPVVAQIAAYTEAQDALAMIATNRAFHAAIADAGGNPYYIAFFLRVLDEGRRLLRLYYQSYNDRLPQSIVGEHEDIIAAIEAGDVELCDRLGRAHADQIIRQIQSFFARDRREDLPL